MKVRMKNFELRDVLERSLYFVGLELKIIVVSCSCDRVYPHTLDHSAPSNFFMIANYHSAHDKLLFKWSGNHLIESDTAIPAREWVAAENVSERWAASKHSLKQPEGTNRLPDIANSPTTTTKTRDARKIERVTLQGKLFEAGNGQFLKRV
jgi:hypothetical protein